MFLLDEATWEWCIVNMHQGSLVHATVYKKERPVAPVEIGEEREEGEKAQHPWRI